MKYNGEAVHVPKYHVQPDFKGGLKSKPNKKDASHVPQPSLEESISFPRLLAALPRWILSSRTPFAGFLAKTIIPSFRDFPSASASAWTFQRWRPQAISSSLDLPFEEADLACRCCGPEFPALWI